MRIFIKTYGCTYNAADSAQMRQTLLNAGHSLAQGEADADVVVLNTCAVKQSTESKILFKTGKLSAQGKKLVLAGCLAQTSPKLLQRAGPDASIIGTFAQSRIAEAVEAAASKSKFFDVSARKPSALTVFAQGVTAPVRISQGCASACTFCQTKRARGYVKSFAPREVRAAVQNALAGGAKELQLTSQDTGCYGYDLGKNVLLPDLLSDVCSMEGDFRVRVGMLNPQHALALGESLLEAFENEKIYKFVHIPVQSGSDAVLAEMKRGYTVAEFERSVSMFRRRFPEVSVETDVIIGFPTETPEDFEETMRLLERVRFDVVNLSKFSPRPGTPAARMPQLPHSEVARRSEMATQLARAIGAEKLAGQIGREFSVLVTEVKDKGFLGGRTENYKPFLVQGAALGATVRVRAIQSGQGYLKGVTI